MANDDDHELNKVQQIFLKYTAQTILKNMERVNPSLLSDLSAGRNYGAFARVLHLEF